MPHINKSGTLVMRMLCAIFFLLFTFTYVYEYQPDILAVTQHVLSRGATHYVRLVGAILITLVLWLLQIAIYTGSGLSRRGHALTYLPSLLILGILTGMAPSICYGHCLGHWVWAFPLLMLAYVFVIWVVRQLEPMELPASSLGVFSRMTWINILQMVVMALIVCGIGCSDQVFHYRMKVEDCLIKRSYAAASAVGKQSEKTDSSLTMLRCWALSEQGKLGDKLFTYPLVGGSDAMLPNGSSVKLMMAPEDRLYKSLGVVFRQRMKPLKYFEKLHQAHRATSAAHDWLLCAYLLDNNLDAFVAALPKYYELDGELPQAYREALILYNHTSNNPRVVYKNSVVDADYDDFVALYRKTKNPQERYSVLKDSYGKTYWFYWLQLSQGSQKL